MGIKAAELRVGNLVYDDYSGIVEVVNINYEYGYIDYKKRNFKAVARCECQYLEPISLTEGWLIRCDKYTKWKWFGDDNYGGYINFIGEWKLMLRHWNGEFVFTIVTIDKKKDCYKSVKNIKLKIKYVHELQNLYYALTNTELTIK